MWNWRARSKLSMVSVLIRSSFDSVPSKPVAAVDTLIRAISTTSAVAFTPYFILPLSESASINLRVRPLSFAGSSSDDSANSSHGALDVHLKEPSQHVDSDDDFADDNDCDRTNVKRLVIDDERVLQDVKTIADILQEFRGSNRTQAKIKLENCGVKPSQELVGAVLSRVRNDWEAAFTFFLWAGKQPDYAHSVREYHAMISILGKMRKFDTAWTLIDEMRRGINGQSLVSSQTLLIMIRRYCAAHDVGRAISTFYAYKRFRLDIKLEDFQNLLSALCRYKNVKDAEHLLFCNGNVFPFETKSFNILLNGWGNVICSPREAERIWKEMANRRIRYDVVSYASIISCYSKSGNLHQVLKLFDRMKAVKIDPDRKVYNAVIHALAKGRLAKEAINLMRKMHEKGILPNAVTYNSLIKPLCKARKLDEAREVLDEMMQRGLSPTIQTYHAFFRALRSGEEVFALLEKMKKTGCDPISETYIMLIRKFCRWRQLDNVFKVWSEMRGNGVSPDRSSYIVLIHGLFLNGKLDDAYKYYTEMKEKELLPEPKIEEILKTWLAGKQMAESQIAELQEHQLDCSVTGKSTGSIPSKSNRLAFHRQPEIRRVSRERGFSFLER